MVSLHFIQDSSNGEYFQGVLRYDVSFLVALTCLFCDVLITLG